MVTFFLPVGNFKHCKQYRHSSKINLLIQDIKLTLQLNLYQNQLIFRLFVKVAGTF